MAATPMPSAALLISREHVPLLLEKMKDLVEATVTTDGEHIVTMARVRTDLVEEVDTAGGRASAAHLAAVIGLDDAKIGKLIKPMWTKDRGRFVVNDGAFEVLTNAYLGSLACEADETAAKLGRVTLKRLASTFKLPIEVTQALVSGWMHSDYQAPRLLTLSRSRLVGGAVVTEAHELTKLAALKAICCIATEPLPIEDLMHACDLHPQEEEMALGLLQGLTESGDVKGSLAIGVGARAYVPNCFVEAQHEAAHAFFSANGYLDHATASELQVRRLHAFVKDRHPNAVCLETVVVSRALVKQLEAVADGAVAEASWFEAWTVVPTILSDADAAHLVGMCAACERAEGDPLRVLQLGVFGVSARFVHDIVARFREEAASELSCSAPGSGADASGGKQPPGGGGGSSRKGGGKQRRRGGSKKQTESDADLMSDEETRCFLRACKPELVDFPGLVAVLAGHLAPVLREAKAEAIRRARETKSADGFHGRADAFETIFERSHSAFQLHCRGVRVLRQSLLRQRQSSGSAEGDPCPDLDASADDGGGAAAGDDASEGLDCRSSTASDTRDVEGRAETHLLRTLGAQLAEIVTARECEKMGIPFASQDGGGEVGQPEQRMPAITEEACSALPEVLPRDVATSLVNLWRAALAGRQLSSFCEILEEQVFPACNLVGRRLEKRRERQLLADKQRAMKETLFQSVSELEVFHFAAMLVFQSVAGGTPLLPRPGLAPQPPSTEEEAGLDREFSWARVLLDAMRYEISAEAGQCLADLQREIEASKAAGASTAAAMGDGQGSGGDSESNAGDASGDTAATRLFRATEAARELGLSCAT